MSNIKTYYTAFAILMRSLFYNRCLSVLFCADSMAWAAPIDLKRSDTGIWYCTSFSKLILASSFAVLKHQGQIKNSEVAFFFYLFYIFIANVMHYGALNIENYANPSVIWLGAEVIELSRSRKNGVFVEGVLRWLWERSWKHFRVEDYKYTRTGCWSSMGQTYRSFERTLHTPMRRDSPSNFDALTAKQESRHHIWLPVGLKMVIQKAANVSKRSCNCGRRMQDLQLSKNAPIWHVDISSYKALFHIIQSALECTEM